jgi:Na+-driven multidrug efflux pump
MVSIGLMTVILIFSRQIALLFTTDETIILGVTASLYVVILAMQPQNGRVILSGALRGAGDVKFVAVCALISVTILRPSLTYLFCYPVENMFPGHQIAIMSPWIAFVIDAIVRDRLMSRRLKQGKWLDIKLS